MLHATCYMIKEKKQAPAIYCDRAEVTDQPSANESDCTPITLTIPRREIAEPVVWYEKTDRERKTPALQDVHQELHPAKLAKMVGLLEVGVKKKPTNYPVSLVVPIVATPKIGEILILFRYQ